MGKYQDIHLIETLCEGKSGRVQYCRHCMNIQVEFGNLIRSFDAHAFNEMLNELVDLKKYVTRCEEFLRLPIIFQFPYSDAYYCFSDQEWDQFYSLLIEAKELFAIQNFLFENSLLKNC